MFKNVLFVSVLMIALSTVDAQEGTLQRNEEGLVEFQEVIKVDSVSQKELYQKAYLWIANTYQNPDEVISSKIEPKMLTGPGRKPSAFKHALVAHDIYYLFQIEVKPNRVRFTMNHFRADNYDAESYLYRNNGKKRTNGQARAYRKGFRTTALGLYDSLTEALRDSGDSPSDDW